MKLSNEWYFIAGTGFFISQFFLIFLVLKLHSRPGTFDNYGVRSEISIFMIIIVIFTAIMSIWFFQIFDPWLRLYIINIPIFSSSLFIGIYSLAIITTSVKNDYNSTDIHCIALEIKSKMGTNSNSIMDIRLDELLQDIVGINEFARFLIGEFSIENLLFIIQISQYRAQFEPANLMVFEHDDDDDGDDSGEGSDTEHTHSMYKVAAEIPTCAILLDHPDDYQLQAKKLINTFISPNAEFAINIDSKSRHNILSTNIDKLNLSQLKKLFDKAYTTIYRLIQLDSFGRFKDSPSNNL